MRNVIHVCGIDAGQCHWNVFFTRTPSSIAACALLDHCYGGQKYRVNNRHKGEKWIETVQLWQSRNKVVVTFKLSDSFDGQKDKKWTSAQPLEWKIVRRYEVEYNRTSCPGWTCCRQAFKWSPPAPAAPNHHLSMVKCKKHTFSRRQVHLIQPVIRSLSLVLCPIESGKSKQSKHWYKVAPPRRHDRRWLGGAKGLNHTYLSKLMATKLKIEAVLQMTSMAM